jgi:ribose transport system substrate-binding protein
MTTPFSTRRSVAALAATVLVGSALAACGTSSSSSTPSSSGSPASSSGAAASSPSTVKGCSALATAQAAVNASIHPSTKWDGPTTGPKVATGKFIAVVAGSLQNGGVIGVDQGIQAAAKVLGWKVEVFDGQNSQTGEAAAFSQALAVKPSGIAVVGFPYQFVLAGAQQAKKAGLPLVGWHGAGDPGPTSDGLLFTNVSSSTTAIGKLAGQAALVAQDGNAHVAILTDKAIPQTVEKAKAIEDAVDACSTSSTLAVDSFPFETITTTSPQLVTALLQRYPNKLTDIFSINDLSFDSSVPALQTAGITPTGEPHLISAGDGSESAFQRIRNGQYQTGTVAEPLHEHGWQVIDEFNRAFAGAKPSGYVTQPHLVVKANVGLYGGKQNYYDPPNGYEAAYMKIWGK